MSINESDAVFVAGQRKAAEDILALVRRSNEWQGNGYGAELAVRAYLDGLR